MNIRTNTNYPDKFPEDWASDWGEDKYGLWMTFTCLGAQQTFRWCAPGSFLMGSLQNEKNRYKDELQHKVTLTQGFWMADTPVTQTLWEVVMGGITKTYKQKFREIIKGKDIKKPSVFKGEQLPIENISWNDAQKFIAQMNNMNTDLKLCLPTEAQWEYACRAGTTTPFFWGEHIDSTQVNFDGNYPYNKSNPSKFREQTVEVKKLPCNDWGLYQMHGNVFEWCQDWYGSYPANPVVDPKGPQSGKHRVLRGGSWGSSGASCRSSDRPHSIPSQSDQSIGFRLARPSSQAR